MDKLLKEGYGLKTYHMMRTRTGLICKTNVGFLELKKARVSERNILFSHDVKERLYQNDFKTLTRYYLSLEQKPFFQKDDTLYIVEELIPKESLQEQTIEAFVQGIKKLGEMHQKGTNIPQTYANWQENRLPIQIQKRKNELGKVWANIKKYNRYNTIDTLIRKQYYPLMQQIEQAEAFLKEANYGRLFERAREKASFSHQSFKGDYLRLQEEGELFVGGFEYAKSDIFLLDVSLYLKRFLKKVQATKEDIEILLKAYHKNHILQKEDIAFLKALAIYPEKVLHIMNEQYNKRRCCVTSAVEEKLAYSIKEEMCYAVLLEGLELFEGLL